MITYELAKQLKYAGFPQEGDGRTINLGERPMTESEMEKRKGVTFYPYLTIGEDVYAPTLSELIEACGEEFGALERNEDNSYYSLPSEKGAVAAILGSTPEEAVAKLWLEL